MNTLIFLSGAGVGALISCLAFIYVLSSVTRGKGPMKQSADQHAEALAEMRERNRLLAEQNGLLKKETKPSTEQAAFRATL